MARRDSGGGRGDRGEVKRRAWCWGSGLPQPAVLPAVIWTCWPGQAQAPAWVHRCQARWQAQAPQHELRRLGWATLEDHLPDRPEAWQGWPEARQSAWVSLALLARHGGVWLDPAVVLARPLDSMLAGHARYQPEFLGDYLDRQARVPGLPAIDTRFMAAVPGSRFVADWLAGVECAASWHGQSLQACARQAMETPGTAYRLLLWRSEDGPQVAPARGRWPWWAGRD